MKKLGFFGGTFDPIHFGHLNLAIALLERHQLDQIHFCPAFASPHKEHVSHVASNLHRKVMVELAISSIKQFSLLDWELERPGLSYTIDTIHRLKKAHPEDKWYLILGEDQLAGIDRWKQIDELIQIATPLIGSRQGEFVINIPGVSPESTRLLQLGMTKIPLMDISSTDLKERLRQKKYCGHLIPHIVLDYIYLHRIY